MRTIESPKPTSDASLRIAGSRPVRPVLFWAGLGAAILAVEAYVLISWVVSPEFKHIPTGADPLPGWMSISLRFWEISAVLGATAFIYLVLIRPWRRNGRISTDGMFTLAFMTIWWQDPLSNWIQTWFVYNSGLTNFGSFMTKVPGWNSPNAELNPYPILFAPACYVSCVFGAVMIGNLVLRRAVRRWPNAGPVKIILFTLLSFITFDIVAETIWLRCGIVGYNGSISWMTISHGHYYQYPLVEGLIFGSIWGGWTCLRFFQNDRGHTIVERGIDQVHVNQRAKTAIQCLAVIGACQALFLGYNLLMSNVMVHESKWPADIQNRSYFMNGVCGKGTDLACPGPGVPIPRG